MIVESCSDANKNKKNQKSEHFYVLRIEVCAFYSWMRSRESLAIYVTQNALQIVVQVRVKLQQGWYFTGASTNTSVSASKAPTYATHVAARLNVKL